MDFTSSKTTFEKLPNLSIEYLKTLSALELTNIWNKLPLHIRQTPDLFGYTLCENHQNTFGDVVDTWLIRKKDCLHCMNKCCPN